MNVRSKADGMTSLI